MLQCPHELYFGSYEQAISIVKLPKAVQSFVAFSFEVIATGKAHIIAAVFAFGREDVIPDMFTQLLSDLQYAFPQKYKTLVYYFDRHIELDGDEHGPMSLKMIAELCGEDEQKWLDVAHYAKLALTHRIHLWDRVLNALQVEVEVVEDQGGLFGGGARRLMTHHGKLCKHG